MDTLLLHPATAQAIQRYSAHPAHAQIVIGPEGSGKATIALTLAAGLAGTTADEVVDYPYCKVIAPEKDKPSISIEAIRDLQHFTKLKLPSAATRRIIVIDKAHTMTPEAQNALLKLLEEPPANTYFILTTANEHDLLETVRSRSQQLIVRKPSRTGVEQYFTTHGFAVKDVQQAYLMSGGLVGLMHALLSDDEHPLKECVQTARQLLQSTQFERLCMVDDLSKQKLRMLQVLFVLRQMAAAAIDQASIKQAENAVIGRWRRIMQVSYDAEEVLQSSAQPKLALTSLMLSL